MSTISMLDLEFAVQNNGGEIVETGFTNLIEAHDAADRYSAIEHRQHYVIPCGDIGPDDLPAHVLAPLQLGPEIKKATRYLHVGAAFDANDIYTRHIEISGTQIRVQFDSAPSFLRAVALLGAHANPLHHEIVSADAVWQGVDIHLSTGAFYLQMQVGR